MSEIPYTPLPGKIKEYFDKFQEAGIPPKVNKVWLNSIGFGSGNDYYIVKVLKFIGLIDDSNVPTELWKTYKDPTKSGAVLAEAIRIGYSDLFKTYEDANRKDHEALYAFFSSTTGKSKRTVDLMITTFTNLCQLANFEEMVPVRMRPKEVEIPIPPAKGIIPEIHINVQLHLPATSDPSVYETLFKSLRKHLLSAEE